MKNFALIIMIVCAISLIIILYDNNQKQIASLEKIKEVLEKK